MDDDSYSNIVLNQSIFDVFLTSLSLIFGMTLMLMLKTTDIYT